MPGESGVIDVHYNTNNVGGFSKTVTVTSNAVDNPRVVLRIKGNVKQDAEQTAPAAQPAAKPAAKPNMKAAKEEKRVEPAPVKKEQVKTVEVDKARK